MPLRLLLRKNINLYLLFSLLLRCHRQTPRGDILLVSDHVVELLAKMYQAVLDATQRQLSVTVTEK